MNGATQGTVTVALDASTYVGSVAVLRGDRLLAERTVAMRGEREERLMPAVAEALRDAGIAPDDVGRVVCGAGPGSFTSLRIAASIAKGLATGSGAALFAAPSLALVVAGASPALADGRYVVAMDGARGEWFAARADVGGGLVSCGDARLVDAATLADWARVDDAAIVGPAPAHGGVSPHARGVAALEPPLVRVDLAAWEPDYGRLAEAQVKWEAQHGRPLPRA